MDKASFFPRLRLFYKASSTVEITPNNGKKMHGTVEYSDSAAISREDYRKLSARVKLSHRLSFQPQGWFELSGSNSFTGGSCALTLGCPDDFYAVRLGFPNITNSPWKLTKVIGRASNSYNNLITPSGLADWYGFVPHNPAHNQDLASNTIGDSPVIHVAPASNHQRNTQTPAWTWTSWAPISSIGSDSITGMRVLMLRALVPSDQIITYAHGRLPGYAKNDTFNNGSLWFMGGIKFNEDRVTNPDKPDDNEVWYVNNIINGTIFPMVQFLTRRQGLTIMAVGDSHHQGTSTRSQYSNFLLRAVTRLNANNKISDPWEL